MLHLNPPETGEPTRAASCALHRVGIVKWRLRTMCCGELDLLSPTKPGVCRIPARGDNSTRFRVMLSVM